MNGTRHRILLCRSTEGGNHLSFVITKPDGEVRLNCLEGNEDAAIADAVKAANRSHEDREVRPDGPHRKPLYTAHPDGHVHRHLRSGRNQMARCPNEGPCDEPGCFNDAKFVAEMAMPKKASKKET